VIGANAVVMRDVEPYTVVSASPARTVGQRSVS
jgi:acetyltransferase-like isoleucine patch superfamily enzyme